MEPILFESTNGRAPAVDLAEAMFRGQAPDRGLYMPRRFPRLEARQIQEFSQLAYPEIATAILRPFTKGVFGEEELESMCREAYTFAVPIEPVEDSIFILRLDRGPTASFKDFAARMMARMIGLLARQSGRRLTILTATSGDTGSAVASAFHRVEGIRIFVLFPRNEVSDRQRRQMTTLGENVRTIAVDGKFDDCQALVKRAFADPELEAMALSSANSINIGRLLPQSIYYFYAASRLGAPDTPVVFAVPSGNFGNMMGAAVARQMGLPIRRLVVPVNENDAFPQFLATGEYHKIEPSRNCLSNAMNVGHPSNLTRLVALYGGRMDESGTIQSAPDLDRMRCELASYSVSDDETREAIRSAWERHGVLLEPHGAVAWRGYEAWRSAHPDAAAPAAVLETAHPAKFPEEIERLLGFTPDIPPALEQLDQRTESFDEMPADYRQFLDYLQAVCRVA